MTGWHWVDVLWWACCRRGNLWRQSAGKVRSLLDREDEEEGSYLNWGVYRVMSGLTVSEEGDLIGVLRDRVHAATVAWD
jgi:hypothetical protein